MISPKNKRSSISSLIPNYEKKTSLTANHHYNIPSIYHGINLQQYYYHKNTIYGIFHHYNYTQNWFFFFGYHSIVSMIPWFLPWVSAPKKQNSPPRGWSVPPFLRSLGLLCISRQHGQAQVRRMTWRLGGASKMGDTPLRWIVKQENRLITGG